MALASLSILIIGSYFLLNMDFMADKIMNRYTKSFYALDESRYYRTAVPSGISVGRFAGFYLDIGNFQKEPIIGYGSQLNERFQGKNIIMMSGNGLSGFLVRFGILGFIFLIGSLLLFLKELQFTFHYRYVYLGLVIILLPLASNPPDFIVTSFSWSLMLLGYTFRTTRIIK